MFDDENRLQFEDELNSFFKNQTMPDESSSDDEDHGDSLNINGKLKKSSKKEDLLQAIDKFNALS